MTYNSLLLQRRKDIHERIGKALEDIYADRLEEFYEMLAYHYFRSNNIIKAIKYSKLAAKKSEANYSHWDAYHYYKDAIDIIIKLPEQENNREHKLEILDSMLTPIGLLGQPEECFWVHKEAEKLSKSLKDRKRLARATFEIANYYSHRGDYNLAIEYSENSFKQARELNDINLMIPPAWNLSVAYMPMGEYRKIVEIIPDVIKMLEKSNKTTDHFGVEIMNSYSVLCACCGLSMGLLGDFNNGTKILKKGIKTASALNDLPILGALELSYGFLLITEGSWFEAAKQFKKSIKSADEVKYFWISAFAQIALGHTYSMQGKFEKGILEGNKGIKKHNDTGVEMYLPSAYFHLGLIYLEANNFETAKQHINRALTLSKKNKEMGNYGRASIALGRILGKLEPEGSNIAENHILKGNDILKRLEMIPDYAVGLLFLGELYKVFGRQESAKRNIIKAKGIFKEFGMGFWLNRANTVPTVI